jgi:putative SOS response-associated peptidase YedK
MINASSETAATKPAFRDALKYRRCLIPADVFYEWARIGECQTALLLRSQRWETVRVRRAMGSVADSSGKIVETCSILTTSSNSVTSTVRDRMPVILDPDGYDAWLDPGMKGVDSASELLKPLDARLMRCYPISIRINHVANDDEECSRPVELAQIQHSLFW